MLTEQTLLYSMVTERRPWSPFTPCSDVTARREQGSPLNKQGLTFTVQLSEELRKTSETTGSEESLTRNREMIACRTLYDTPLVTFYEEFRQNFLSRLVNYYSVYLYNQWTNDYCKLYARVRSRSGQMMWSQIRSAGLFMSHHFLGLNNYQHSIPCVYTYCNNTYYSSKNLQ